MSIEALKNRIPDAAKDIRLNLSSIVQDEALSKQQLWGCLLASAFATGQRNVIAAVWAEATGGHLDAAAVDGVKSAVAIMSMNNVYYRSTHMMSNESYQSMPARLRMNVIANPGVDKADFELWSLAVSAINGCQMCLDAHEGALRKEGMTPEQIQTALRIAATVNAVAGVIAVESVIPGAEAVVAETAATRAA